MKNIKQFLFVAAIIGNFACYTISAYSSKQQDDHNHKVWLMLAQQCDQMRITECPLLTAETFMVTDEHGRNIYQIAWAKYQATGAESCLLMALFLYEEAQSLCQKNNAELAQLQAADCTGLTGNVTSMVTVVSSPEMPECR